MWLTNSQNSFYKKSRIASYQSPYFIPFKSHHILSPKIPSSTKKKFPELYETQYLDLTVKLSGEILNKITTGNIKYSKIYSMWVGKGKKELLKERLSIILFNNIEDVEKCMKSIEEKFKIIIKENGFLKKINGVLKEFYEVYSEASSSNCCHVCMFIFYIYNIIRINFF